MSTSRNEKTTSGDYLTCAVRAKSKADAEAQARALAEKAGRSVTLAAAERFPAGFSYDVNWMVTVWCAPESDVPA